MAKENKTPSYAEALAEIETILAKINGGNPDIDSLAADVKRATELIELCRRQLRKTEEEINGILNPGE